MKLIDKDALVAEIEGRISINETCQKISGGHDFYRGAINEAKEIISIIDNLEVKEVNFDEAGISNELAKYIGSYGSRDLAVAKHFYELGIAVSNKTQKGEEYDRQSTENP